MAGQMKTVIGSLNFSRGRRSTLKEIPEGQWPALLKQTDAAQLTLPLAIRCRDYVPATVRDRLGNNLRNNTARRELVMKTFRDVSTILRASDIDFLVLKGFTHWPDFAGDLRYR